MTAVVCWSLIVVAFGAAIGARRPRRVQLSPLRDAHTTLRRIWEEGQ